MFVTNITNGFVKEIQTKFIAKSWILVTCFLCKTSTRSTFPTSYWVWAWKLFVWKPSNCPHYSEILYFVHKQCYFPTLRSPRRCFCTYRGEKVQMNRSLLPNHSPLSWCGMRLITWDYLFNTLQHTQGYNIIQEKTFCLVFKQEKKAFNFCISYLNLLKRGRRQGKHCSQVIPDQALMQLGL